MKSPLLVLVLLASAYCATPPIFEDDFDSASKTIQHFGDTTAYKIATGDRGPCMQITHSTKNSLWKSVSLDVSSLRGWRVQVSAWGKASNLSPLEWEGNGLKVMLSVTTPTGKSNPQIFWPQDASFGWTWKWITVPIPPEATEVSLTVGFEEASGTVFIDSIVVMKIKDEGTPPARAGTIPIPQVTPTRLRGAMVGDWIDSAHIATFGKTWKGNLFRWQLNTPYGTPSENALGRSDYDAMLTEKLALLDKALPICKQYKIKVAIDLHGLSQGLFLSRANQSKLISVWKTIAAKYKDSDAVWAYDLANEPAEGEWQPGSLFWDDLADTLARAIRAIDPNKVIIVEPVSDFNNLRPIGWKRGYDIQNVLYSPHFYRPHAMTHQGEQGWPMGVTYPGEAEGQVWDSLAIGEAMQDIVDFQNKYRVPIYVGEFSCIRWAINQSAYNWLEDVISWFEKYGWDWSYHAYQEYHGWSVEYGTDQADMATPVNTDRKALLLHYFAENSDPYAKPNSLQPRPSSPIVRPAWTSFYDLLGRTAPK